MPGDSFCHRSSPSELKIWPVDYRLIFGDSQQMLYFLQDLSPHAP